MKEQQLRKNSDAGSWEIIPSLPAYFICTKAYRNLMRPINFHKVMGFHLN